MADGTELEAGAVATPDLEAGGRAEAAGPEGIAGAGGAVGAGRMLLGARGAAAEPDPRKRLTPRAALALQRTIGNRALSRRMLMRYDWDGTGSDTPDEPYIVTASG